MQRLRFPIMQVWQPLTLAKDELEKMSRLANTLRESLLKRKQELALSAPLRGGSGPPTLSQQSQRQLQQQSQSQSQQSQQSQVQPGFADPAEVQMTIGSWRLPGSAATDSDVAHTSEMPTATGAFEARPTPQPEGVSTRPRPRSRQRTRGNRRPSQPEGTQADGDFFEGESPRLSQSAASSGQAGAAAGHDVQQPSLAHARARFGYEPSISSRS